MSRPRLAVVGSGAFGRNHLRVLRSLDRCELVAAVDILPDVAASAAREFGCAAFHDWRALVGRVDAAVVAVPTRAHAEVGCGLLEAGIDVLVEKPLAPDAASARRLLDASAGRVLAVGHLERFNPAVEALRGLLTLPLFFEIHRLSLFSPRSLDVDVVLDLMIHDLDIVLSLTGSLPGEIRAAGIAILSRNVDIASVRLAFDGGCIANLTASRVSTERVRKLRLFQPGQYLSLDYSRQDVTAFTIRGDRRGPPAGLLEAVSVQSIPVVKEEPLRRELEAFLDAVEGRSPPRVSGQDAFTALEVALAVQQAIGEHLQVVAESVEKAGCGNRQGLPGILP